MHEPSALVVNLLLLLLVIAFGPFVAERLRLPGIIGLLLGGFLIGPAGLNLLRGTAELESLGHIGLLYLMFVAGLELDLNVFARLRGAAIQFGLLTFALPLGAGFVVATYLGFDAPAAILIGSLWASHTLVMYPVVQRYGIVADPAVATTVGATVITDTLALLVLAFIAGGVEGSGDMGSNLAVLVGLGVLGAYCMVGLTFLTRWFFAGLGQDRELRFVFIMAAFMSAAVVAEIGGIEGIVGAFFAGLALNRYVPNGGPLMERTEFFGSALFIPAFLVSVGLLIDPAVLADPRTWQLAIWFAAALFAGKGAAAFIAGRIRGFSGPQVLLVFALSVSQAAATLAATTVGADVGLFGDDVVNAVVVVIVISLFTSSILAGRAAARVTPPTGEGRPLAAAILVAMEDGATATRLAPLAAAIARRAGGVVVPAHIVADGEPRSVETARVTAREIDDAIRRVGVEAEPSLRVAGSVQQGVRNEIRERDISLLILSRHGAIRAQDFLFGGLSEQITAASPVPVVIVELDGAPVQRVLLPIRPRDVSASELPEVLLAAELAGYLEASGFETVVAIPDPAVLPDRVVLPEDVTRVPLEGGRARWIAATAGPGDLVLLPAGGGSPVFGLDAARVASMPGVSVAVVVGPFHGVGLGVSGEQGRAVVRSRAASV